MHGRADPLHLAAVFGFTPRTGLRYTHKAGRNTPEPADALTSSDATGSVSSPFRPFRIAELPEDRVRRVLLPARHRRRAREGWGGRRRGPSRRPHLVPVPQVDTLAELNARLVAADLAEDARHIDGRAVSVGVAFAGEAPCCCRCPRAVRHGVVADRAGRPLRPRSWSARCATRCRPADRTPGPGRALPPRSCRCSTARPVAPHPRLSGRARGPRAGSLPGDSAGQARCVAGIDRAGPGPQGRDVHRAHEAFWAAARTRHGDAAGTRALIEVLLLHRRCPPPPCWPGSTAALAAGSCPRTWWRSRPASTPPPARDRRRAGWPALRPRRSRAAVVTLAGPARALPADQRPAPSVADYDQLLAPAPGKEARDGPGRA